MKNTIPMKSSLWSGLLLICLAGWMTEAAQARSFRVSMFPNGSVFRCANCHVNPAGGGVRNAFGKAVENIVGTSSISFWSPALAKLDSDGDGATNGEELGDPQGTGVATPGATVTNPGDPASKPAPQVPIQLDRRNFKSSGRSASLSWTGGKGVYLVQKGNALTDTNWINYLTTKDKSAILPMDGDYGFYRIVDNTQTTVIPLTVWLGGEAEIPPLTIPGQGFGILSLEGNILTYRIGYRGLSSPAMAAHIHGPASSTGAVGVLYPLSGVLNSNGLLAGKITVTSTDKATILGGMAYVNIHTSDHQGGEIRGQIAPVNYSATLTGSAQVPPVATTASGTATFHLTGNQLQWTVNYSGLSTTASAAHIHGPADPTTSASPLVALPNIAGTSSGSVTGVAILTQTALGSLVDGLTYINIHTTNNPAGEIRGQILPKN